MKQLLDFFKNNEAFLAYGNAKQHLGNISLIEEALMIAFCYQKEKQALIIVKHNVYTAQKLYEVLSPLLKDDVLLFSVEESMRIEALSTSNEIIANKVEVLYTLRTQAPKVVITHISAYTSFLANPKVFDEHCLHIKVHDSLSFEGLKKNLYKSGYEKKTHVDQPLTYASRGGIVDVFSMNYDMPIRIEFFDDDIESIRFFDIESKKTLKKINEVTIIAASDVLFSVTEQTAIIEKLKKKFENHPHVEEELQRFKEYEKVPYFRSFYSFRDKVYTIKNYVNNPKVVISNMEDCKRSYKHCVEDNIAYIQEMSKFDEMLSVYTIFQDFYEAVHHAQHISLFADVKQPLVSQVQELQILNIPLEKKLQHLKKMEQEYEVYLCVSELEKELIMQCGKDCTFHFETFPLSEGFLAKQEKLVIYTSRELFDVVHHKVRYRNKFRNAEVLSHYQELEKGDYIVHKLYGVGQYIGIINRERYGIHKDYLKVAYKDNDILFVPLEQFRLVRKFVSKEGMRVKLNRLGSNEWEKTKRKVSENVKDLADRLVNLYALREKKIGFSFSKDNTMQTQFEEDFDYILTKDQTQAINEIKKDMQSDVVMDRLLCGDVGFGKTEVALRGAFKAIMDNKQVAFLCPTTILSLQHLHTTIKRFRNFPITIKVVNRFVSRKEMTQIKKELIEKKIDLLIGTHRLFSKDIVFKDLGLLIIDEEQRFGVEHKEKIKELKNSVDVLSLSATPIPRTLQMSLVGIRSLSQLHTPPINRVSVQTYVVEKDFLLVKEIIEREVSRQGQVFYLYNKVKEIHSVASSLQKHMNGIRVGVAHGQMSKEEIEDVMYRFTSKEYDVLVCTTIIETGIDIPNANTILIEDADTFGLSQLYQIKGRVGRSDRLAYAYLMYAPNKQLSEIATKRLKTMKEFAKLGSGYQIALRDLTIRGAGEMLGPKQAGFIDTVGIDMYMEMLHDAIKESKGETVVHEQTETKRANIKIDAYIPEHFEEEDYEKITLYQQIEKVKSVKALLQLQRDTQDVYGSLPKAVASLFQKKHFDILMNMKHVETIKEVKKTLQVIFTKQWSMQTDGIKLFALATTLSKDLQIRYTNQQISATMPKTKDFLNVMSEFINVSLQLKNNRDKE
ncbi:MAG: transcription-repair coupling factor [Breznakia sp.]